MEQEFSKRKLIRSLSVLLNLSYRAGTISIHLLDRKYFLFFFVKYKFGGFKTSQLGVERSLNFARVTALSKIKTEALDTLQRPLQ